MKWFYKCSDCGAEYEIEPGRYLCDKCKAKNSPDQPLHGILECRWSGNLNVKKENIPLPIEQEYFPPVPVGNTPLWKPEKLRNLTGFTNLWLKDDTCNPSGSFKDRASFLVAAFALKHGIREIALASTGNAASSMACIGAAADLNITVFLPARAPAAKRVQVLQYGAELREVNGTYDMAFDQSLQYSLETGVLSRNTAYNPLTIEGKKTAAWEIVRDLEKQGKSGPDHVFIPVGDGVILAGLYKGFEELVELNIMDHMPVIWACQAEGSSAIARALENGAFGKPVSSNTLADSISVDVPRNGLHALSKLVKYKGKAVVSSDNEILEAQCELSSCSGLFAEPSSACAWAGFRKIKPEIGKNENIVVLITGSGLKDIVSASKAVGLSV